MTQSELKEHQLPPPRAMPPGLVETEQMGVRCGDRPLFVHRIYEEVRGGIGIALIRHFNWDYLHTLAGEKRVGPGEVQGHEAVFIQPLTPAGNSNSYIAFRYGDDLIVLEGLDIGFDDLLRAAETLPLE